MNTRKKYLKPTLDVEVIEIEQGIAAGSTMNIQQGGASPEINDFEQGGNTSQNIDVY